MDPYQFDADPDHWSATGEKNESCTITGSDLKSKIPNFKTFIPIRIKIDYYVVVAFCLYSGGTVSKHVI